jgi:ATP-dependent exoDNAse (exonuclease V) beta subunit
MFRNADYKIMRDLLDKAEGRKAEAKNLSLEPLGGELKYVNLPVNYRSDGEVLAYVNKLFKEKLKNIPELIGQDLTELTSYEQAVLPGRVKDGFVKTDILEAADVSEDERQKEWLLDVVAGARGRYPLNEIAILVSKNARIEPVVEWLAGAGVPVASLSSLDIRKRRVVAELLALLKFLETPSDDLSFSAFITGDIFTRLTGLAREELRDFILKARAGGEPILYAAFRKHPRYEKYWGESLDQVFRKVGYLPFYELVSLIYNSFKLFENFPDEQAFLSRFLDAVISLEAEGVTSPRAFLEYAAVLDEDKAKVFSIALPEYIDAVRVMTFHKSKGLGFSVVINLMFEEQAPSDPMYFEEKDGEIHVYHITKAAAEVSAKLRPIYEGRKADSAVQDLNLLYVISTRARHELYNLVVKKIRKTPAKEARGSDLFETYRSAAAPRQPARAGLKPPAIPVEIVSAGARPEGHFETLKPTYTSYFETAEGNLVHEILAQFLEMPKDPAAGVSAQFDRLAPKYSFKFDKPKVVNSIVAFLAGPQAAPLFAPGAQALVEAEFVDRNGSLFRMDRVLLGKDKITVVDFKTGHEDMEKYKAQMQNYLAIISEVYGKPAEGLLAYVDLNKVVAL